MALNKNQIDNFSNYYSRTFDMWELNSLFQEYLEKYVNNHFRIYRLMCNYKGGIKFIENTNNRFLCEIPSKKEHVLLKEINKNCYIKVNNRITKSEPLNSIYNDNFF